MRITEKEFQNLYKVHILGVSDIVGKFDCEDVELNDFLANEALPYQEAKIAVTYVVEDNQNGTPWLILVWLTTKFRSRILNQTASLIVLESENLFIPSGCVVI